MQTSRAFSANSRFARCVAVSKRVRWDIDEDGSLKAYRWQYIVSGVQDLRFAGILAELTSEALMARIVRALSPLM